MNHLKTSAGCKGRFNKGVARKQPHTAKGLSYIHNNFMVLVHGLFWDAVRHVVIVISPYPLMWLFHYSVCLSAQPPQSIENSECTVYRK